MYTKELLKERINLQIKEKGGTVKSMLEQIGLNENTVNQITDKKGISSFSLAKIADFLDCSVDYLLGRSENPNQEPANTNCNVISHGDNIGNMDITIHQAENDFLSCFLKQFQSLTYSEQLEVMNIVNEKAKR